MLPEPPMDDDGLIFFRNPKASWRTILICTWKQMRRDNLSGLAAGAAYYALLSIFPALAALVSIYGLIADPYTVQKQVIGLSGVLPQEAVKLVADWLHTLIQGTSGKFGIGLVVGVLAAYWSAWSATGTLMTAVNICYQEEDTRGFLKFTLEALVLSTGLGVVGAVGLGLIAVLPILVSYLPEAHYDAAVILLARWPIMAVMAMVALAVIYRYAPAQGPKKWQWISWGAALATGLWLIGSILFSVYVARLGTYDKTYGSVGAIVVLLFWLYMSAYVALIGAELNAELERQAIKTGQQASKQKVVQVRSPDRSAP